MYKYGRNNPVMNVDPSGLVASSINPPTSIQPTPYAVPPCDDGPGGPGAGGSGGSECTPPDPDPDKCPGGGTATQEACNERCEKAYGPFGNQPLSNYMNVLGGSGAWTTTVARSAATTAAAKGTASLLSGFIGVATSPWTGVDLGCNVGCILDSCTY